MIDPAFQGYYTIVKNTRSHLVTRFSKGAFLDFLFPETMAKRENDPNQPYSSYLQPLYDSFDKEAKAVAGVFSIFMLWERYFENLLPDSVEGLYIHPVSYTHLTLPTKA